MVFGVTLQNDVIGRADPTRFFPVFILPLFNSNKNVSWAWLPKVKALFSCLTCSSLWLCGRVLAKGMQMEVFFFSSGRLLWERAGICPPSFPAVSCFQKVGYSLGPGGCWPHPRVRS